MVADTEFSLQVAVEVDGTPLPDSLEPTLEQVIVDDHLHLPGMFMLAFRDPERTVLAAASVTIGSRVVIRGSALGDRKSEPLITGEVTALEAEYDSLGGRAIVRGYDPSHRFHRGRQTQTYRNVTDADIARTVAGRVGVEIGNIDESDTAHEHVSQANLSDWDFLKQRAKEIGFEMTFIDGKFEFRRPPSASSAPAEGDFDSRDPLQLVMGQDLLEFRPRVTSSEQVKEVQVRGWDPVRKEKVVGVAPAAASSAQLKATPAGLAKEFGSPILVAGTRPLSSQSAVDGAASALAEQIGTTFAEAVGVARGNPRLRAGTPFSVSVVADQFEGRYVPSTTRHVFDRDGYRTEFTVSGRQDRSLLGLASGGSSNGSGRGASPIHGMVVAKVTGNDDPSAYGRVKLTFPWLSDDYESDWARVVQLGAGPSSGAVFLPEVGDEVLVAFEFGDVRRPYVIGGLYNGVDKPSLGDSLFDNGKVKRRGFVSRKGHRLVLLDDDRKSGVALLTSDGKLRLALDETAGEIRIFGDHIVKVEAAQKLTLKAGTDLELEASSIKIKGSGTVDIDGATITLN